MPAIYSTVSRSGQTGSEVRLRAKTDINTKCCDNQIGSSNSNNMLYKIGTQDN